MGIMLVNKLRESAKKVVDHIDFQSEFSALAPADLDQAGLQQLTTLETPVSGVLEQDIFYVNQIMKFGKFFAVFQDDPSDANKTVVTAFMVLAIKARVLDEKRGFENMPVLRNLVPAQVLMGQSSFNSGEFDQRRLAEIRAQRDQDRCRSVGQRPGPEIAPPSAFSFGLATGPAFVLIPCRSSNERGKICRVVGNSGSIAAAPSPT